MAFADEDLAGDLAEIIDDLPATLTWSGQTITVTIGDLEREDDTAPEGVFNDRRLEVAARVSDFTDSALPAVRESVTIASATHPAIDGVYFIQTRLDSPDGSGVNFELMRK